MSEQRASYALPKTNIPRKLEDVGVLSESEIEVILLMRRSKWKTPRPLIVIEQLGDAVRLHETFPSKYVKL